MSLVVHPLATMTKFKVSKAQTEVKYSGDMIPDL